MTATQPLVDGPKRQHFLPRFYLDGFTKEGVLAVYDREANEIRVQQPVNTGVIGHFYTLEDEEGRKRFEVEKMLSEFEAKASPTIRKLAAKEEISADERSDLAIFVALAGFRTPDIVDSLKLFNSEVVGDVAKRMFTDVEQVKKQMRGSLAPPQLRKSWSGKQKRWWSLSKAVNTKSKQTVGGLSEWPCGWLSMLLRCSQAETGL